jgi:hypothetical protein
MLAREFRKDHIAARYLHNFRGWVLNFMDRREFNDVHILLKADQTQTCKKLYSECVSLIAQSISDRRSRKYRGEV